jgi:hypothetical protein
MEETEITEAGQTLNLCGNTSRLLLPRSSLRLTHAVVVLRKGLEITREKNRRASDLNHRPPGPEPDSNRLNLSSVGRRLGQHNPLEESHSRCNSVVGRHHCVFVLDGKYIVISDQP